MRGTFSEQVKRAREELMSARHEYEAAIKVLARAKADAHAAHTKRVALARVLESFKSSIAQERARLQREESELNALLDLEAATDSPHGAQ